MLLVNALVKGEVTTLLVAPIDTLGEAVRHGVIGHVPARILKDRQS